MFCIRVNIYEGAHETEQALAAYSIFKLYSNKCYLIFYMKKHVVNLLVESKLTTEISQNVEKAKIAEATTSIDAKI